MTNEEKTMRTMYGKVALVPDLDKFLTAVKKVAKAVGMDEMDFMIVTNLEMLRTTLVLAKEQGTFVNLDGVCEAMKKEVYGDDNDD